MQCFLFCFICILFKMHLDSQHLTHSKSDAPKDLRRYKTIQFIISDELTSVRHSKLSSVASCVSSIWEKHARLCSEGKLSAVFPPTQQNILCLIRFQGKYRSFFRRTHIKINHFPLLGQKYIKDVTGYHWI